MRVKCVCFQLFTLSYWCLMEQNETYKRFNSL
nr:MAG TPA: hypothetical protein [Caudoviricetes sp.]